MAEAMAERGASATVADAIARSGVSSAVANEMFADREACVLAAFDLGVCRARKSMIAAYDAELRWLDAIKAALSAFLRFLEIEPALGRLLVVYSMSGGERVLRRRSEVLAAVATIIDRASPPGTMRLGGPAGKPQPPTVIAEGVVGAVLAIIHNRLLADASSPASSPEGEGEHEPLIELFGPLVSIIVLPYLGAGVARRELTRPAPRVRSATLAGSHLAAGHIANGREMRLTDRTARVLSAIAYYPGASNREVADRAGVVDQGQISKLLARLQGRELIANTGEGRTRGAPNAWQLTGHGEALLASVPARRAVRG